MTCLKKYFVLFVTVFMFLCNKAEVYAQTPSVDAALTKAFATDELLPLLIESAVKNSGNVRRFEKNIHLAEANLKINKNTLYNGLSLISSYYYGTNYAAVADATAATSFNRLTTTQTGFYNVGVGFQLPLTTLLNRKHLVKSAQMQIEMIASEKDNAILGVKEEVIRLYQELKLSQKLLAITNNNKQGLQMNYSLAEKEFVQGQITVEQISRVLDINNKAKMEYETALNRFQTNLMQLENFTGVSIVELLKRVK